MLSIVALFCIFFGISAQDYKNGSCPSVHTPKTDFYKMTGEWYQYKCTWNLKNINEVCLKLQWNEPVEDVFKVIFKSYEESLGITSTLIVDVNLTDPRGGFTSHIPVVGPIFKRSWFLEVDSDHYSIVWSCENFGSQHIEYVWIYTRSLIPPNNFEETIKKVFKKYSLELPDMYATDYQKCRGIFDTYKFGPEVVYHDFPNQEFSGLSLSCFLSPNCLIGKLKELYYTFLPPSI